MRIKPETRDTYFSFLTLPTRWSDNDIYGHVNNVTYYSYFDTAVNNYLIEQGGLDIHNGAVIGLAVETHCNFFGPAAFPEILDVGLRVAELGRTSVKYEIAMFIKNQDTAIASGHFIHVFVDRGKRRPVPMPVTLKTALERLLVDQTMQD